MTFYERIENQGTQTLAVWMFIELLARMCNVLRLRSEVCNWLPATYLKKKEYSLHSAFCTQPAFYSQSAVWILHSLCIFPRARSLRFTLTGSWTRLANVNMWVKFLSRNSEVFKIYTNYLSCLVDNQAYNLFVCTLCPTLTSFPQWNWDMQTTVQRNSR